MLSNIVRNLNLMFPANSQCFLRDLFLLFRLFLHKPLLKLLVVFEQDIELLGKVFVPLVIILAWGSIFFVCIWSLPSLFHLPFVFLEESAYDVSNKWIELRTEDTLFQIKGANCLRFLRITIGIIDSKHSFENLQKLTDRRNLRQIPDLRFFFRCYLKFVNIVWLFHL